MNIRHTPDFAIVTGPAVQAVAELSNAAHSGTDDPALANALGSIGDPTGETWNHLFGLCVDLEPPRTTTRLIDHIDAMDAMAFRLTVLGHTAWSWRSIVGGDTIERAALGDAAAQSTLLDDDRYYARVARDALRTVLPMDATTTKDAFLRALRTYTGGPADTRAAGELDHTARRLATVAETEGWLESIELACGFRYIPEPEARRVVVMPHMSGPSLLLAQHDDARLIVYGEATLPAPAARLVEIGKALSDESRVHLLSVLGIRPHQLGELIAATGLTRSTVHHHLRQLRAAGLVTVEGNARAYRYKISQRGRADAINALGDLLGTTPKGRPTS